MLRSRRAVFRRESFEDDTLFEREVKDGDQDFEVATTTDKGNTYTFNEIVNGLENVEFTVPQVRGWYEAVEV